MSEEWYYYCFYDNYGVEFFMRIKAPPEKVEELLEEYRSKNEDYNDWGFLEFLRERGIEAEFIEPIYIYF